MFWRMEKQNLCDVQGLESSVHLTMVSLVWAAPWYGKTCLLKLFRAGTQGADGSWVGEFAAWGWKKGHLQAAGQRGHLPKVPPDS